MDQPLVLSERTIKLLLKEIRAKSFEQDKDLTEPRWGKERVVLFSDIQEILSNAKQKVRVDTN